MHRGNRLALVVRIPFCTDSSSDGRPSLRHWSRVTSDASRVSSRKGWVSGMLRSRASDCHDW